MILKIISSICNYIVNLLHQKTIQNYKEKIETSQTLFHQCAVSLGSKVTGSREISDLHVRKDGNELSQQKLSITLTSIQAVNAEPLGGKI